MRRESSQPTQRHVGVQDRRQIGERRRQAHVRDVGHPGLVDACERQVGQ